MGTDRSGVGGETVLIASPPFSLRPSLGEAAARLVVCIQPPCISLQLHPRSHARLHSAAQALLTWRLQRRLVAEFGESRPLFLAGALLTRNEPPAGASAEQARSKEYDPGAAHGECHRVPI